MISSERKNAFFIGDFNINTLNDYYGAHVNFFTNLCVSNGYFNLITKQNRVTLNSKYFIIGNIYTIFSIVDNYSTGTIIMDFPDHYSVFCYLTKNRIINNPKSA